MRSVKDIIGIGGAAVLLLIPVAPALLTYPLDAYERTGIRRLVAFQLVQRGERRGRRLPPGARLRDAEIRLHLAGVDETFDVGPDTPRDRYLQRGLERIFDGLDPHYSIALLDITDPLWPRYAALRETRTYSPGSVGKLMVMTGAFAQLARRHPDVRDRERVLRETTVVADSFIISDHHVVPIVDMSDTSLVYRPIRIGDRFSLWEWIDHMASPSSNAAASTVWQQVLLMHEFGARYPPTPEQEARYFRTTRDAELRDAAVSLVNDPLWRLGLDTSQVRQGSLFTAVGQRVVPGRHSYASPRALLRYLIRLEQGRVVDEWSSLEMKKLLYVTRRRIRYAAAPALHDAAVYFKSGSLYSCEPEPGYDCGKYRGNRFNFMNSVAIIESPAGDPDQRVYLVVLMSNVLRKNSAADHAEIARRVERLIQSQPEPGATPEGGTDS